MKLSLRMFAPPPRAHTYTCYYIRTREVYSWPPEHIILNFVGKELKYRKLKVMIWCGSGCIIYNWIYIIRHNSSKKILQKECIGRFCNKVQSWRQWPEMTESGLNTVGIFGRTMLNVLSVPNKLNQNMTRQGTHSFFKAMFFYKSHFKSPLKNPLLFSF